ncbi:alpha/beta hydrolase [Novosphingobium sp. KCTC 2891]|uniref:alpha/beta hydrolase n=1 Tax=Novosphingobium sp. KCTC 2891 TaxID=2989730 RepID=UPI002223C139|nr:alpha/beta hydrolase [Novosphingobium sp. KCTC 2891]MCW1384954.1 alpha/beta hydrolase [Novosphingobium sp. KCTC 2891]
MGTSERVIYFHGMPGGAGELDLFGPSIAASASAFHVPERRSGSDGAGHFRAVAEGIRSRFPHDRLRLIGFSIGASAALRVAPHLGDRVAGIDVVSAAAPLGIGPFLDDMAGAPVFRAARASPLLFGLLVRAQSLAARLAPGRLYTQLFASARGADSALAGDPVFRAAMIRVLRQCLAQGAAGYRCEVGLYVQDWAAELALVTQPVRIWHGRADNWSPVAMADALAERLPASTPPRLFDGLSHYSTLQHFLLNR